MFPPNSSSEKILELFLGKIRINKKHQIIPEALLNYLKTVLHQNSFLNDTQTLFTNALGVAGYLLDQNHLSKKIIIQIIDEKTISIAETCSFQMLRNMADPEKPFIGGKENPLFFLTSKSLIKFDAATGISHKTILSQVTSNLAAKGELAKLVSRLKAHPNNPEKWAISLSSDLPSSRALQPERSQPAASPMKIGFPQINGFSISRGSNLFSPPHFVPRNSFFSSNSGATPKKEDKKMGFAQRVENAKENIAIRNEQLRFFILEEFEHKAKRKNAMAEMIPLFIQAKTSAEILSVWGAVDSLEYMHTGSKHTRIRLDRPKAEEKQPSPETTTHIMADFTTCCEFLILYLENKKGKQEWDAFVKEWGEFKSHLQTNYSDLHEKIAPLRFTIEPTPEVADSKEKAESPLDDLLKKYSTGSIQPDEIISNLEMLASQVKTKTAGLNPEDKKMQRLYKIALEKRHVLVAFDILKHCANYLRGKDGDSAELVYEKELLSMLNPGSSKEEATQALQALCPVSGDNIYTTMPARNDIEEGTRPVAALQA